jgi:CDP-6-deoxy-D-xylo-4-hexulose-3-dehydrase
MGDLPKGYDHKYTYSHAGYNLKVTDMQAALGLAQLERLEGFIHARRSNFRHLRSRLECVEDKLVLPEATHNSDPSWFGFPITVREGAHRSREELTGFIEKHKIGTRLLFGGNLTRQPYFAGRQYRISGTLANTDAVMRRTFWIGIYPGLSVEMLDFAAEKIIEFMGRAA